MFFCNPRGGDGRGNQFADLRGKYGTIDYSDIMAFTDKVLEKYPQIDAQKLCVTGGSYGGFMTNWIIGHTNRFRAAATQRSIANWVGFGFTSDIGEDFARDQMGLGARGNVWNSMETVSYTHLAHHLRQRPRQRNRGLCHLRQELGGKGPAAAAGRAAPAVRCPHEAV